MQRLAFCSIVIALSGCFIYFEDDEDVPNCPLAEPASGPGASIAPIELRNPDDLTCRAFGYPCDPACGPCPAVDESPSIAHSQPLPSWGYCESSCEGLGETACAARSDCRVVKDAFCAFEGVCITDFVGCFPTDQQVDTTVSCTGADAWACSRNPDCAAWHDPPECPPNALVEDCPRSFVLCTPEGTHPGSCFGEVACDEAPPACPSGTTPGISGACYTGACIPLDRCGPSAS